MNRLTVLSSLLVVGLAMATGCQSQDSKSMAQVPPPADSGPPITSSNANLYDSGSVPPPTFTTVTPVDTTPIPALPAAQQNVETVTLAAPLTSISGNAYTVKQGDTLWRIASNKYGNGQKWRDIVNANPGLSPSQLRVGQTINLP